MPSKVDLMIYLKGLKLKQRKKIISKYFTSQMFNLYQKSNYSCEVNEMEKQSSEVKTNLTSTCTLNIAQYLSCCTCFPQLER